MSEKTEVDQDYDEDEEGSESPPVRPEHQYSKDELLTLRESPASRRRPKCLERAYDAEDGKWDPDRWYKAKFGLSREASPLTLGENKDRRRLPEIDRDIKRRPSLNDPVERLKEERDTIVLSPQRRSFGTGCHVQTQLAYTRQSSMPERDRDDSRGERDRDRDPVRDRERDNRDRPVRKIGSGRIAIDRENSRDFSGLRDRFDDRDIRDRERDRDFTWNRDRDRDWDRDMRDRDRERDLRDRDWDRDGDRRFDRSDRFRRVGDRDFPERDRRDRDFRDRGFERNSRRRNNYREEEKEPEWFTGGPTSQTDTIELRGFEREPDNDSEETASRKSDARLNGSRKRITPMEDKSSKASSEEASEMDVKVSQRSSPEEDQQNLQHNEIKDQDHAVQGQQNSTPQPNSRNSPSDPKSFDFEEILKASLPLDEENVRQSSRFSRFFPGLGGSATGTDSSIVENMLVPHDLLDDSCTSPGVPSPTSMLGPKGAVYHADPGHTQHGMHHYPEQHGGHTKEYMFSLAHNMMSVPNSAGDNNAAVGKSALPPVVTALFNSAAAGGSNACKWKPRLDCSVETLQSSLLSNSAISSNNSFSTQDAEAQLKAMLFGGHKESASSSGTASPASLPPNVQRKVKTVAELEADMHQNSPQKTGSPIGGMSNNNPTSSGDMTAFNKLLIMINAASEANQNATQTEPMSARTGYGLVPSHSEFNHAVQRNKEEQIQLLQQSLQNAQRQVQPQPSMLSQLPPHSMHHHQMPPPSVPTQQQPPPPTSVLSHQQAQAVALQHLQKQQQLQQQAAGLNHPKSNPGLVNSKPPSTPGLPQAMSTPHQVPMKPRSQSGGPVTSTDPIFNLIQQNPTIVMNPASPAPPLAAMLVSQPSAVPNTARVPSPLMFSQQPPLHLSAPSPIHPGQLSPRSLTVGANLAGSTMSSPSGMRSPVRGRVLSPQELSAHAQAVMQGALIKKQLQDQNERYIRKQQERAKSPSQQPINVVKSQPGAQPVLPPNPQPRGASVNTFTPTSVLRKMHSDKALEKEKQAQENKGDEETEYMPSMRELSSQGDNGDSHSLDGLSRKSDPKLTGDLSDISFLDPVNPNLVAMSNQLENQLRIGQTNILPGTLSQPMSVEEKLKLSALAEKPGYLSQMLDKSAKVAAAAEAARAGHGRPIVKAPESSQEERNIQQHQHFIQQQQMQQPPPPLNQGGRPVTGSGTKMAPPSFATAAAAPTNMAPPTSIPQNNMAGKQAGGRAIVGGNSIQQQSSVSGMVSSAPSMDMRRLLEQQHLQQQQHMQRMQQVSHSQGMVVPPPSMGTPIACLGPPPVAMPVTARFPVVATNAPLMQQHYARANAQAQHNHYMAMQQAQVAQQQRGMTPLSPLHTGVPGVSGPLSPRAQASGPLTTAALSTTIQRVASPHGGMKMNGPLTQTSSVNGGSVSKVDVGSGIQRWFSPDILKTQLPSMPPLPTQGSHVMTVDELERN